MKTIVNQAIAEIVGLVPDNGNPVETGLFKERLENVLINNYETVNWMTVDPEGYDFMLVDAQLPATDDPNIARLISINIREIIKRLDV